MYSVDGIGAVTHALQLWSFLQYRVPVYSNDYFMWLAAILNGDKDAKVVIDS